MPSIDKLARTRICFHVKDMTCAVSSAAVRNALVALDEGAEVRIDLPLRRVVIESDKAEPSEFGKAIDSAGYASIRQWPAESMYI